MEWIVGIMIGLFAIGSGIAIYEWRKKKTLMSHDFDLDPKQSTQVRADLERASAQAGMHGGMNGPHGGF